VNFLGWKFNVTLSKILVRVSACCFSDEIGMGNPIWAFGAPRRSFNGRADNSSNVQNVACPFRRGLMLGRGSGRTLAALPQHIHQAELKQDAKVLGDGWCGR